MTKKCNSCGETKPIEQFSKDKNTSDGHYTICKVCKHTRTIQWREKNRDKYNSNMRAYQKKHYQKFRLMRYDLTPEEHAKMMHDQKGVCAICEKLPNGKRPLVVDHNHTTGKVRGLLCYGCNRALHILEAADLLQKALAYLKKSA